MSPGFDYLQYITAMANSEMDHIPLGSTLHAKFKIQSCIFHYFIPWKMVIPLDSKMSEQESLGKYQLSEDTSKIRQGSV